MGLREARLELCDAAFANLEPAPGTGHRTAKRLRHAARMYGIERKKAMRRLEEHRQANLATLATKERCDA